tara:strand:- start:43 stop:654 length:612 start_codon:yes stop_codon:yes gene_type:complete
LKEGGMTNENFNHQAISMLCNFKEIQRIYINHGRNPLTRTPMTFREYHLCPITREHIKTLEEKFKTMTFVSNNKFFSIVLAMKFLLYGYNDIRIDIPDGPTVYQKNKIWEEIGVSGGITFDNTCPGVYNTTNTRHDSVGINFEKFQNDTVEKLILSHRFVSDTKLAVISRHCFKSILYAFNFFHHERIKNETMKTGEKILKLV